MKARKVVIGYNYHFGKRQMGNVRILKSAGKHFNFEVEVMEPLEIDHTIVSSSKIRELIKAGKVEDAAKLLGRNYPIIGKVVKGSNERTHPRFSHSKLRDFGRIVSQNRCLCSRSHMESTDIQWPCKCRL